MQLHASSCSGSKQAVPKAEDICQTLADNKVFAHMHLLTDGIPKSVANGRQAERSTNRQQNLSKLGTAGAFLVTWSSSLDDEERQDRRHPDTDTNKQPGYTCARLTCTAIAGHDW